MHIYAYLDTTIYASNNLYKSTLLSPIYEKYLFPSILYNAGHYLSPLIFAEHYLSLTFDQTMILHCCFNFHFTRLLVKEWATFHILFGCHLHLSSWMSLYIFCFFLLRVGFFFLPFSFWFMGTLYIFWIIILCLLLQIFLPVYWLVFYHVENFEKYILYS